VNYVETSGKIQISIAPCGCGRLDVGNTMIALNQNEVSDMLYVFKNLMNHIEEQGAEKKQQPAQSKMDPGKLKLVKK